MKKLLHHQSCSIILFAFLVSSAAFTGCGKIVIPPFNPSDIDWSDHYTWGSYSGGSSYDTLLSDAMKYINMPLYQHYNYKDSASNNIDSVTVAISSANAYADPRFILQLLKTNAPNSTWFKGLLTSVNSDSILRMNSDRGIVFEFHKNRNDNKIINNLVINDIAYVDVLESTSIDPGNNIKIVTLWTPGVGLIKMTTMTPSERKVITLVKQW
ncbi:MAG: hypothetical protein JWQ09_4237 [Segetibacter sp.]|nr:hypothetical protein [Segetibacter sp.]